MRKIASALIATLLVSLIVFAGAGSASPSGANDAAVKKCRTGYALKTVTVKKRVNGKVRRVRVKRCVKIPTLVFKGSATHRDTSVRYGAVLIHRRGNTITRVQIRDVATTGDGCPAKMTLDYVPGMKVSPGTSPTVKGNKVHLRYQPNKSFEYFTTLDITFSGRTATGRFSTNEACRNTGLFSAKR